MSFKIENEILQRIKEVEKTLNFKFEESLLSINNKIKDLLGKFDSVNQKVEILDNNYNEFKVKTDKIDEIIVFKNKSIDQLNTHELRINQLITDAASMRTKYDKMFIDNFTVPGFVGEFCKFKTIRDYIENNIKEMVVLNSYKDQSIIDLKSYGTKIENLIQQFTGSLDKFSDRQKEILNNTKNDIYFKVKDEMSKLDDKFEEMKIYNTNEAKKLCEKTDDLIKVTKETTDFRDRLKNYFEQNLDEITSDFDEIRLNVSDLNDEYNSIKDKFKEIIDFVKDFNQKKYTNKKEESTKRIKTFQRQKTVNFRNRKVDFLDSNLDLFEKKSSKNFKQVDDLEKSLENKKKIEITQKLEDTIENKTEINNKEKKEKIIEKDIIKQSEKITIKKKKENNKEIIKEPEKTIIKNDKEIIKEPEKTILKNDKEIIKEPEKNILKQEKEINEEEKKIIQNDKEIIIKEPEKNILKKEKEIIKERDKTLLKKEKEKVKEIKKRQNREETEIQNEDRSLTVPKIEYSSDEDYSPIILPKYLSQKKTEVQKRKEKILLENNYTVPLERKQNSDITPLNLLCNYQPKKIFANIIEFDKRNNDEEKELSKKEFEELELKKNIVNLRLYGKGNKSLGTTVYKDFNEKYMSKTNSYFYTNNNNNDIGIKKKRESIDCGKIKLKKRKKIINVSDIFYNKANIINRKIEEIYELFEKNKY